MSRVKGQIIVLRVEGQKYKGNNRGWQLYMDLFLGYNQQNGVHDFDYYSHPIKTVFK